MLSFLPMTPSPSECTYLHHQHRRTMPAHDTDHVWVQCEQPSPQPTRNPLPSRRSPASTAGAPRRSGPAAISRLARTTRGCPVPAGPGRRTGPP